MRAFNCGGGQAGCLRGSSYLMNEKNAWRHFVPFTRSHSIRIFSGGMSQLSARVRGRHYSGKCESTTQRRINTSKTGS